MEKLSRLSVGCWSFGGGSYWGHQEQKDVDAVVAEALDSGLNYFDTAEVYNNGDSEKSLGLALDGKRDKAIIGTKVSTSNTKAETLRKHCEQSLKNLRTDYIDIYMLHWPINEKAIVHFSDDESLISNPPNVEETFHTMAELQKEGKILNIGVSNHGVLQMKEVMKTGVKIAFNELPYNLISRAIETEIAPFCVENDIKILGYMAYQQGVLSGKYQDISQIPGPQAHSRHFKQERGGEHSRHMENGAEDEINLLMKKLREYSSSLNVPISFLSLSWTLQNNFITSSIVGNRNAVQLRENIKAANFNLPIEVKMALDSLSLPIWEKLGISPDYYENRKDSRIY